MIRECVGPRCSKPGISRSMSGMMENANNKGTFTLTFRRLDDAFPDKYPRAKCPTAYISYHPSLTRNQISSFRETDRINRFALWFGLAESGCAEQVLWGSKYPTSSILFPLLLFLQMTFLRGVLAVGLWPWSNLSKHLWLILRLML